MGSNPGKNMQHKREAIPQKKQDIKTHKNQQWNQREQKWEAILKTRKYHINK